MERITPRTLSGFMELLPEDQQKMQHLMDTLRGSFSLHGFTPLDTPLIEAAEVLLAKGGGETEKQIYRFTKGESDLALRFDLTVPLAKYVALHQHELAFPFRRYQIGKVFRGERAQRGRFREFYQADIDIIGDGALHVMNEAEIPAVIYRSFRALGLNRFRIRINNRKLLGGFFARLGLSERVGDLLQIVDKLDKLGAEKVRSLLSDNLAVPADTADEILAFLTRPGSGTETLAYLERYRGCCEQYDEGLEELSTVVRYVTAFGVPEDYFEISLSIARGLDYYTGTVYETILTAHPEIGSVCSGGRYDNLAGFYTDRKLPGVGISIGVTRLFYLLQEQGMLSCALPTAAADALVVPMDEPLMAWALGSAAILREAGIRTQVHFEGKKMKQKLAYADRSRIPFAVIVGESEAASGTVTVKDMAAGTQASMPPTEACARILTALAEKKSGKLILD